MKDAQEQGKQAVFHARQAYSKGNLAASRRWAQKAVTLAPDQEEAWLWLAATAKPHASLEYLKKALQINPQSQRARSGIHWVVKRIRAEEARLLPHQRLLPVQHSAARWSSNPKTFAHRKVRWATLLIFLAAVLLVWFLPGSPAEAVLKGSAAELLVGAQPLVGVQPLQVVSVNLSKATRTPTPTNTPTPTPTPTDTPTPTPTSTPTPTATYTFTPLPTNTPLPTDTPPPPPPVASFPGLPAGVGEYDRWIDVNLSEQRTYAFEGQNLVKSFIVSTGTYLHPTVTGTFQVYLRYRYSAMAGPGYYLPDVPYVMYFYKGYGVHGTYWHNNFGTPMSHGCVNLTIEDAGWLFDWSTMGTVVNVHY
jgi:lipoprotein-anchoring transpeptidase ErfK/SrfK